MVFTTAQAGDSVYKEVIVAKGFPMLSLFLALCLGAVVPGGWEGGMEMADFVPASVGEWLAEGEGEYFPDEAIFTYMNGAGEVYRSYSFRTLFVRTFAKADREPITVELFDMGSPADAFGIFSRNRRGEDVGVGQGSEYDSGYLLFWRGRYFVAVYALEADDETKGVVFELGRAIAEAIGEDGPLPAMLSLLPADELVPGSERYFHLHTCLNHHYYLSDDNLLGLAPDTEAAIGEYGPKGGRFRLLLVHYPAADRAEAALARLNEEYLPAGGNGEPVAIEDGSWAAARTSGELLALVLDAPDAETAAALLAAAVDRIEEENR